jgi:SAM-dependent methyltransferase
MNLWSDFLANDRRPIHKWKHYFPVYEAHLARFCNRAVTMLEIGCGEGGSLQMWKRFLGPYAQIVGLDISPRCRNFEEDQIAIRIGDQKDPALLQSVLQEFGAPDIIIDDGSHRIGDIAESFRILFPALANNGVYIVEDLHTAYWPEYGGALKSPASFIEYAKSLVDTMNADHTRGAVAPDAMTRSILSLHFYDSMVAIEKGRRPPNLAFITPS